MVSDDEVMTLQEYLAQEERLEEEALAAYPGKFDDCTYGRGYIRQSLYTCRTCIQEPVEGVATICYSCSVSCHPLCDLIEVGARRKFRCDCGNALFEQKCQLEANKSSFNGENDYTRSRHNFYGQFCACRASYDPEIETDEMIQCLVCEDWYHENCLYLPKETLPVDQSLDLICKSCQIKYPFLSSMIKHPEALSNQCLDATMNSDGIEHDIFLDQFWRQRLCNCPKCETLLKSNNLDFLYVEEPIYEPEPDDTIEPGSSYDAGIKLLEQKVNRKVVMDGIMAMDQLKNRLMHFLEPIAQENRTVTREVLFLSFQAPSNL